MFKNKKIKIKMFDYHFTVLCDRKVYIPVINELLSRHYQNLEIDHSTLYRYGLSRHTHTAILDILNTIIMSGGLFWSPRNYRLESIDHLNDYIILNLERK